MIQLWAEKDAKEAFQKCKQDGGELVVDSFRLFLDELSTNKKLYNLFGTKK